jgi:hypothetical protein
VAGGSSSAGSGSNERRLLHELAHYQGLRHWTGAMPDGTPGSCVLASAPPAWPFVWDTGIHIMGPSVAAVVESWVESVPVTARMAWRVWSGWIEPRLCILSEPEVALMRDKNMSAGEVLDELQTKVIADFQATGGVASSEVSWPAVTTENRTGAGRPETSSGAMQAPLADLDGLVSGVACARASGKRVHHVLTIRWPSAALWRAQHGLQPRSFEVVLGLQP